MADKKADEKPPIDPVEKFLKDMLKGKYKTLDEAGEAMSQLEAKLGEQGNELGQLRGASAAQTKALKEYDAWVKQAQPIVKFVQDNQERLAPFMNGQQTQQVNQAAAQQVANVPGVDLLTAQEKQALYDHFRGQFVQNVFQPWTQRFATEAENWVTRQLQQQQQTLGNLHSSFTNVLWRTLEKVVPKENIEAAKRWHDESLKFADPSKLDPMKAADDFLSLQDRIAKLEGENNDYKKKDAEREKAAIQPLSTSGLYPKTQEKIEIPKNREERFSKVMGDVTKAVGTDAVRETFPAFR